MIVQHRASFTVLFGAFAMGLALALANFTLTQLPEPTSAGLLGLGGLGLLPVGVAMRRHLIQPADPNH